jgi:hypothetical protein
LKHPSNANQKNFFAIVVTEKLQRLEKKSADAVKQLSQKWPIDNSQIKLRLYYLPESAFETLDDYIKRGLDPGQIRLKYFIKKTDRLFHSKSAWSKSTVEGLAARGFPIDCDSVPVIDD